MNEIIIYKIFEIFEIGNPEYSEWYGTDEEIEKYLDENKDHIAGYNEEDSWTDNLRRYGLTYKEVWSNRK